MTDWIMLSHAKKSASSMRNYFGPTDGKLLGNALFYGASTYRTDAISYYSGVRTLVEWARHLWVRGRMGRVRSPIDFTCIRWAKQL